MSQNTEENPNVQQSDRSGYEYPDGLVLIGHSGSVLGFTGSMYWVEGTDVAVAVLANVGTMHSGRAPGSAGSVARARAFIDQAMRVAGAG